VTGMDLGPDNAAVYQERHVTALLCGLMRQCATLPAGTVEISSELATWWTKQQIADAKREAEDQRQLRALIHRQSALAKLTPDERLALGVG